MNTVGDLASGIWEDLSQPQSPSITYISGWVSSSRGLGKLNTLLNTCFSQDSAGVHAGETYVKNGVEVTYQVGDFYPYMCADEEAIYTEIYKIDYYDKKIRDALNGIIDPSGTNVDWNELREGDSVVKRSNRNETVKSYRGLQQDAKFELQKLIGYYRENKANPSQVAGTDGL